MLFPLSFPAAGKRAGLQGSCPVCEGSTCLTKCRKGLNTGRGTFLQQVKLREGTDGSPWFFLLTSLCQPLRSKESSQPTQKSHQTRNLLSCWRLGPIVIPPPTPCSRP